jgi:hypothetical protein
MSERYCGMVAPPLNPQALVDASCPAPHRPVHRRPRRPTRCRARERYMLPPQSYAATKAVVGPLPVKHTDTTVTLPRRLTSGMRRLWRDFDPWATDKSIDDILKLLATFAVRPDSRN